MGLVDTSAAKYTVMVPPPLQPHAPGLQPHAPGRLRPRVPMSGRNPNQVGRMPESTREGEALSAFFGQWGEVVHCAVVLNYRDLILASRHRAACREALHHRQVE